MSDYLTPLERAMLPPRKPRTLARFPGASLEHRLANPDGTVTRCGKDATLAHRYPFLTRANSTDRRPWKRCAKCE